MSESPTRGSEMCDGPWVDTPCDTGPCDTPHDTPVDTSMDTPVDTPVDTPMGARIDTSYKALKQGTKTRVPRSKALRRTGWAARMAHWIGTYDSFLEPPEDLFEDKAWSLRPRPDGSRCLLVRNHQENVFMIGKGGHQYWVLRDGRLNGRLVDILNRIPEHTVLDGIWDSEREWFYVFDLLVWHGVEIANCEFEARYFFLHSKWSEFITGYPANDTYDQCKIRLLLIAPKPVTPTYLTQLYTFVKQRNVLDEMRDTVPTSGTLFDILQPFDHDLTFLKYDGLVFTHNEGIYTPCINPFMLHWRNPDISIWAKDECTRKMFKGCLAFTVPGSAFSTCDGTKCELRDCTLPKAFVKGFDATVSEKQFLVRISYNRLDLKTKASGEITVAVSGVKVESWKLQDPHAHTPHAPYRWNGADSFSRLVFNLPLYDENGHRIDTSSPTLDKLLSKLQ
eukprot:Blabericola_migrator_1__937@NODE_1233_length_5026_cov_59_119984_g835_i0_p2_GENE_NODE_1233_length_5026_cov_59_119984_g835_i0NODE_1233_length_5026_cov_59_119984_g835_i0_p2_ORF_typecomplete_len510_score71_86mRNA_cap_enzyme/PF01331_19/7_1e10DNA_ligase_A_M/PF01068_21/0_71DNA_ligase_A_M/PF01068_21/9_5e02_NODE_1233_length_5026_cov_59_119984_g835_i01831532